MIITNAYAVSKDRFPLLLNESKYCPKQLYAAGNLPSPTTSSGDRSVQLTGIAMVGTRRPGRNAQELCRKLVSSLRGTKAVIVSGLAQGIDSLCHEAALEVGLPTIAVLGQGLRQRRLDMGTTLRRLRGVPALQRRPVLRAFPRRPRLAAPRRRQPGAPRPDMEAA